MRSKEELEALYRFAERDLYKLTEKHSAGKVSDAHFLRMSGYYKGKMCGLWCALGCPTDFGKGQTLALLDNANITPSC